MRRWVCAVAGGRAFAGPAGRRRGLPRHGGRSFNELIGNGYKVLAYDSHGSGASDSAEVGFEQDVVAAAETLRADGATSIVLMGASLGGASSIVAATLVTPPVTAVVAVSSPLAFGGVSAQEAAPPWPTSSPTTHRLPDHRPAAVRSARGILIV